MAQTIDDWLAAFDAALRSGDADGVAGLFTEDCYWRDLLSFTWNITTLEGRAAIADMLRACLARTQPSGWARDGAAEGPSAWITFETGAARGVGRVTLRDGRCHVLFTAMADLKGHEEPLRRRRPMGLRHKADRNRETWLERRQATIDGLGRDDQPEVVIIGGGQGGVALAARLKQLSVPALVIEKNPRIGDSWRNRYRSLVLHDPVWYDHLPYLPFPDTWPVFCPKDKIGDWLEAYALIFELDCWTGTEVTSARYDATAGCWTVAVRGSADGAETILTPRQLVFATGAYGPPRMPDFPGQAEYAGTLLHSSHYASGAPFAGKRAAVIGAGSSAHDVAVDLWEAGAEVTMIQRRPSIVVRSETLMELGFDIYSEDAIDRGLTTDKADLLAAATPYALFADQQKALYREIRTRDAEFYAALDRAGFDFDFGEDDTGLMMRALRTASGYYIDVGASTLIAEGQVAVARGGVERLTPDGLRLEGGQHIAAEVIVACTGYQSMNEAVAGIVDRDTADALGPCWGLGSGIRGDPGPWQGELRNMWKPTAHPALWFHGGNLALSRFYSRFVAMQLKARQMGIATPVYGRPAPCAAPAD